MFKIIKKTIVNSLMSYKKINLIYDEVKNDYKSTKALLGKIQSENNRRKSIKSLKEVEFQVFSQFGDDGIIQYLINKIPIKSKTFIEFGVENYRESNTRFLLINDFWSGFIIDGSQANIESLKSEQFYSFYDLKVDASFITKDNINDLLDKSGFAHDIGILSVDIDGNDFWIWSQIERFRPTILTCEYNSLFGFEPYTIPYEDDFVRGVNTSFNFYGTSLRSIYNLSSERGYTFVGCNSAGNNAYFIKNEFLKHLDFPLPSVEEGYVFAAFSEVWDIDKNALRGGDKIGSIDGMEVYNTESMKLEKVDSSKIIQSLHEANRLQRNF